MAKKIKLDPVSLVKVKGVGKVTAEDLKDADIDSAQELADAKVKKLSKKTDMSKSKSKKLIDNAKKLLKKEKNREKKKKKRSKERIERIISHFLIPEHIKLTEEEKKELLEQYKITMVELPRISIDDPAIKHMNLTTKDVVKIIRKSPIAGETVFYRRVVK